MYCHLHIIVGCTCIFPGNKKKRLLLFFVLVILIDIQNICSINSRALAVGLMAYGHIGSQFIRLHINMDSLKCTSFLWSLQRHRSCVRPLIPPVDWGRGYKTIVVLRLFDYSPLLTRKIAVDKQAKSYTCKWKKTVSGQSPSHCSKTLSINRWESLRMSFNRGGTELVSGYCRSV